MQQIIIGNHWKELSDFTIHQAVLLTLGIDPDDYYLTVQGLPHLATTPAKDTEEEYDAIDDKVNAIRSAIRSRKIRVTQGHWKNNALIDPVRTYIAKDDLIVWWRQHGYSHIADLFDFAEKSQEVQSTALPVEPVSEPTTDHSELARGLRGCKRHIVEHWQKIREQYGKDADGHQVLRFLKTVLDETELPALKTVQNKLSELRKVGAIP